MARRAAKSEAAGSEGRLVGWAAIARHLGQRVGTAQKWAKDGMPVRREGRYVAAEPDELAAWLAESPSRQDSPSGQGPSGRVFRISHRGEELAEGLRESLSQIKKKKKMHRVK